MDVEPISEINWVITRCNRELRDVDISTVYAVPPPRMLTGCAFNMMRSLLSMKRIVAKSALQTIYPQSAGFS